MLYIFDWDGTLCRSLENIVLSIQAAAHQVGLPELPPAKLQSVVGLGLQEAWDELYPQADEQQRQLLVHFYREHYLQIDLIQPTQLFDGVEDTLQHLCDEKHQLAIATGKSRKGLNRALDDLEAGHYFVASRCADEARSKPDPLMLQQLLEMTGFHTEESVMVGDTEFDLKMAGKLGMKAVGVTYGAHPVDRLAPHAPIGMIGDIRELLNLSL